MSIDLKRCQLYAGGKRALFIECRKLGFKKFFLRIRKKARGVNQKSKSQDKSLIGQISNFASMSVGGRNAQSLPDSRRRRRIQWPVGCHPAR